MTSVLLAVTGSDYWTLADGSKHPCGYWPEELAVPHEVFRNAGLDITIATPHGVVPTADEAGFTPEMNGGSETRGKEIRNYLDNISAELNSPAMVERVNHNDFDFIFVPGGHGPMEDLAESTEFGGLLRAMHLAGKPIAAVCHGPAALFSARNDTDSWLFDGYQLTGFTNVEEGQVGFADRASWLLEDRIKQNGGVFSSTDAWAAHVVVDRNLYTGQNPASSQPLAEKLVADLDRLSTS
ncbi:putative intracellular protease/amidase (plasmid) [Mycolicibacterium chubuense NBB4]|uniref:Putative intracellular protease/amidase n=1 Tax=Mycolicibacterium chubuense (strain NBB4) TaxID=710421 RepID=I4BS57_MYCCN|nr:type 1 glutamine amidotransferase domain-containing protein [Mycolicibacterium chubuense]AFM20114.1 putative intracellular protease/amidase [Mycolicibacterium chubuense NBB4]